MSHPAPAPAHVDVEPDTLYEVITSRAASHPGRTLLWDAGHDHDYAGVLTLVDDVAARLAGAGIRAGDRVVLWHPNGVNWVATFLACARLGAVAVLANTRLKALDLAHIVDDSGAAAVVFAPEVAGVNLDPVIEELARAWRRGAFPHLRHLVATRPSGCRFATWLGDLQRRAPATRGTPGSAAVACYTSGSTGTPKGCLHSQATLVRNGSAAVDLLGLTAGDRVLCPVPFSHVFGFHMGVVQCILAGATLINAEPYSAATMVELATAQRATVAYAVPTMAREFAGYCHDHGIAVPDLRVMLIAGAPVIAGLRHDVASLPPTGVDISVVYGCTETPTLTQLLPGEEPGDPDTAVGRPTPGVELRIAEPGGVSEVPPGEVGEILTRGYNRMLGYLGDPVATAARIRDGWFATGDLGWMDETAMVHIVGRHSDMFLVGGFNAYPTEIARQLEHHTDIGEAAVVGVPDERLGAVPMAWVVPNRPDLDADDVLSWAQHTMAAYKRPRYVKVIDALPRTATNKVATAEVERMSRTALPHLDWVGPTP